MWIYHVLVVKYTVLIPPPWHADVCGQGFLGEPAVGFKDEDGREPVGGQSPASPPLLSIPTFNPSSLSPFPAAPRRRGLLTWLHFSPVIVAFVVTEGHCASG